ncbi:MAG: hypothetical protein KKA19_04895, partial [Candidatus Margulisbacteria bacterium]|nr:hypothetical protein [Candidatus Margulisiibacteriota bacterium]
IKKLKDNLPSSNSLLENMYQSVNDIITIRKLYPVEKKAFESILADLKVAFLEVEGTESKVPKAKIIDKKYRVARQKNIARLLEFDDKVMYDAFHSEMKKWENQTIKLLDTRLNIVKHLLDIFEKEEIVYEKNYEIYKNYAQRLAVYKKVVQEVVTSDLFLFGSVLDIANRYPEIKKELFTEKDIAGMLTKATYPLGQQYGNEPNDEFLEINIQYAILTTNFIHTFTHELSHAILQGEKSSDKKNILVTDNISDKKDNNRIAPESEVKTITGTLSPYVLEGMNEMMALIITANRGKHPYPAYENETLAAFIRLSQNPEKATKLYATATDDPSFFPTQSLEEYVKPLSKKELSKIVDNTQNYLAKLLLVKSAFAIDLISDEECENHVKSLIKQVKKEIENGILTYIDQNFFTIAKKLIPSKLDKEINKLFELYETKGLPKENEEVENPSRKSILYTYKTIKEIEDRIIARQNEVIKDIAECDPYLDPIVIDREETVIAGYEESIISPVSWQAKYISRIIQLLDYTDDSFVIGDKKNLYQELLNIDNLHDFNKTAYAGKKMLEVQDYQNRYVRALPSGPVWEKNVTTISIPGKKYSLPSSTSTKELLKKINSWEEEKNSFVNATKPTVYEKVNEAYQSRIDLLVDHYLEHSNKVSEFKDPFWISGGKRNVRELIDILEGSYKKHGVVVSADTIKLIETKGIDLFLVEVSEMTKKGNLIDQELKLIKILVEEKNWKDI